MSVGRNGREAGIVKTRGITVLGRAGQDRGLRLGDRARGADVNPYPVETQSMQAARGRSAREQKVQRERPVRRTVEEGGCENRDACIDERHDLALGARSKAPMRTDREITASLIADAGCRRR